MHGTYQPAPLPEWVYYLAVFHRAFVAIRDYGEQQDRDGMLMGGFLADALHNVPNLLYRYGHDVVYTPKHMPELLNAFPNTIEAIGGSFRLVEDARRIVSRDGAASELGLRPDTQNDVLAPPDAQNRYLNLLYTACLFMRTATNFNHWHRWDGSFPAWREMPWVRSAALKRKGQRNGLLAGALEPIPAALVRWHEFDEPSFWQERQSRIDSLPEHSQRLWRDFFTPGNLRSAL